MAAAVVGDHAEALLAELRTAWTVEERCLQLLAYWGPQRDTLREVVALEAPHAGELAGLQAA